MLFSEVFQWVHFDELHLQLFVKMTRLPSIVRSNSFDKLGKGVQKITYSQVTHWLEGIETRQMMLKGIDIRLGEGLSIQHSALVFPLGHEPMDENTLPLKEHKFTHISDSCAHIGTEELADFCWSKSCRHISAFSKLRKGGSIFFGVDEEKKAEQRKEKNS
jgi:hypothetical protein